MFFLQDTTDEDSDFEEGYRKKTKPIMLKIKKEKVSFLILAYNINQMVIQYFIDPDLKLKKIILKITKDTKVNCILFL